ncbi:PREDICTED: solute carrier family 41 member 1-like isoform X2 [Nicrophorus vespilloides]|uniref:Solute carrier family 41 member 1-like isoform X2 n=1 Tax=Nicrophorus vespilloides TaxID=110193 RepID=A0ABM1MVW5_NICVS|nr:PREDICTED: solute carrier family 41 member 1-like isoform X2 [Nicrophorus vespilloides]XP_017778716.1 PREDICTED: solute carrier family 41 member 1-like isoform X2 [Nicrophorus vespilloides]XP_017778717.1 PREDICTED: solute carrier family 41 member 1-like isoform X2 [Nicrophorus vespilloides]XP_017778718.1 PREDICTED: solute carrier family 41 member 1-like isoform X2 [Nicrophorus vespilloides]
MELCKENYGPNAMESHNLINSTAKAHEDPSPSDACIVSDMELTLVSPTSETNDNDNGRLPDVVVEAKLPGDDVPEQIQETYFSIAIQVFIPFLIAGFGMVFAGLVLDRIQHWPVFEKVTELVILIPALLGLKGNLEMTLASRLSTQANLGHMDTPKQQLSMIIGNLTLIQCQAIVVGFLGSVVAVVMGAIKSNDVELDHAYLLCASSLVTVSIASLVLGLITAGVIVLSRLCHINPDNVATPIAASLGDITSLALLSWVATLLYKSIGTHDWLAPLIIAAYILAIPLWIWIAKRNLQTRDVLYNGWTPVVGAMLISSMGGLILDFMVSRFEGIAVFQPVINGVGGNLVAVQASRISTALHKQSVLGVLSAVGNEDEDTVIFISPVAAFWGKGTHARTTRVLMAMVLPGHLIFIYTIDYMKSGDTQLSSLFVIVYLCAATMQVATLLYVAYIMIHWMWKRKIDPDNSAIPYLTSMGDLLGISLLAIAFQFLYLVGDHEIPDPGEG